MNERVELHYQGGGSDKVYVVELKQSGQGHVVHCHYGRRGGTLNFADKTMAGPISYMAAKKIFDKAVKEKVSKGYQVTSSSSPVSTPAQPTNPAASSAGIMPQLLNPVRDEAQLEDLILDPDWWMQEKMDGERRMLSDLDGNWRGSNKKGMQVELPASVEVEMWSQPLPANTILDGEIIGDVYYVFDVIRWGGTNMADQPLDVREGWLAKIVPTAKIKVVIFNKTEASKRALLEKVRAHGGEGVVLKRSSSPYAPGRPNSGGTQLKYKFVESATVIVTGLNVSKRSVAIGGYDDDGKIHELGNVTIPPNHKVPQKGNIVEVRYLYAYGKGGSLYQPVYLGQRSDQGREDCVLSQLKYKRLALSQEPHTGDARWAW